MYVCMYVIYWGNQDGSTGNQSLIPEVYVVGENWLQQVVLWPPYTHCGKYTLIYTYPLNK